MKDLIASESHGTDPFKLAAAEACYAAGHATAIGATASTPARSCLARKMHSSFFLNASSTLVFI